MLRPTACLAIALVLGTVTGCSSWQAVTPRTAEMLPESKAPAVRFHDGHRVPHEFEHGWIRGDTLYTSGVGTGEAGEDVIRRPLSDVWHLEARNKNEAGTIWLAVGFLVAAVAFASYAVLVTTNFAVTH